MELVRNYIGGQWVPGSGGELDPDYDPATGEVIAQVTRSTPADARAAAQAAAAAFPAWRKVPAPQRGEILYRVGEILRQRKEELARLLTREMGKVLVEARGDVQEAIDMAYYMAGEGRRMFGHTVPSELPDKFAMSIREPVGVVAAITPWNFPIAVPSWKILPALVCGNTVVWKPAPETPMTSAAFVQCFIDAGLPPGVLNLVVGGGADVGAALVEDPDVRLISFTGSTATGRKVAEAAGRHLKRVTLELGGKNAITVLADADLDLAVEAIVWAAFGTTGQRCTAASRVIVEEAIYDELVRRLVERVKRLRLGHGLEEGVEVGPLVGAAAVEKVQRYVEIGRQEGAEVIVGGEPVKEGDLARGFFYSPTILGRVSPEMAVAQEEIFGPVLALIPVKDLDEAIRVNNSSRYGLSASIFTRDLNKAFKAMRELDTGIVYVNHGTTGAEIQLPFGGTKDTGNGHREAGQAALDVFCEWKSVYVDYSGRLQRAQIDTEALAKAGRG
ncbi:aldehyde dehydrogenase family protein [Caldinitratiruptor microaerophilus]|uniref:3-sulfolactaldehyde dehydrogenase n=1 Tax=Caldinitratiruptor microaerophilus TaxID=671077 RepID=A0AA35CNW9_9FIRM|nr:aldehyde dehydrogenase family protein [Caldinitratiruptor microaerophilus]BDG61963.1 aldehyde dehydrogenase [Caldinitratiruptor microaerophilus]